MPMLFSTHYAAAAPIEIANASVPYLAIESISLPDLTDDGFADIGIIYLDDVNNKLRLQIIDGVSLEQGPVIIWNNIYDDPSIHLLPNLNGNNMPEVGIFGVRNNGDNAGKPQLLVKDLSTGLNARIFNWPANWQSVKVLIL
jgi:hypothetical protein